MSAFVALSVNWTLLSWIILAAIYCNRTPGNSQSRLRLKNEQFIEPSPNRGQEPVAHSIQICHAKSREKILDLVSGRVELAIAYI